MRHALQISPGISSPAFGLFQPVSARDQFRQRFQCALSKAVKRGFHVEECFGVIWEETLDEVELCFREQNELFPELIEWAKGWMQPVDARA